MDIKVELAAVGGVDQFRIVDCGEESPGPLEVRVRHHAIGVNFIDIYLRTGLYPIPKPAVLGVEGAGIVEAIGTDVKGIVAGDRVAYAGIPGAYAATRLLPAWRAIKLPDEIDSELAAASFLRGLTAHMLLTRTYRVERGTRILVHAAAGGLGTIITRWAKQHGCEVIGTTGTPEKAELARANGADHVIIGRGADIIAQVGRLTNGLGVDFAIDGIGGETLRQTLGCVRRFGVVASIGQAAGFISPLSVDEIGPVRSLSLARPSVMAYAAEQGIYPAAMKAVIDAMRNGVQPNSLSRFSLGEVANAQKALEMGQTTGSLVLVP